MRVKESLSCAPFLEEPLFSKENNEPATCWEGQIPFPRSVVPELLEEEGEGMEQKLHYKMSIKLWKEEKVFGPGICQLLMGIDETGSMHQAAARMGLAYSKAWKMMKTTEKGLGFALTERVSGGRRGGGSRLTEEGRNMMEKYQAFESEARQAVDTLFEKYFL